ncbi:MAG: NUDIX domain-containing protein [Saprospiraceae bacterium]
MRALESDNFHPGLSVDCVIFGFHENELRVLLLKLKGQTLWALPGGFVEKQEDVDHAVVRVLHERTGLRDIFLQQFHFFGDVERNLDNHAGRLIDQGTIPAAWREWFEQRFVTVGYYALVEYSRVNEPQPDYLSESCEWCSLSTLPELMLDHKDILQRALMTLRQHLNYEPIGLNLLPRQFTMPELRALYETVLGRELDRGNFQRKLLAYNILRRTGERRTGKPHKAPLLYEFDEDKYYQALKEGLKSVW